VLKHGADGGEGMLRNFQASRVEVKEDPGAVSAEDGGSERGEPDHPDRIARVLRSGGKVVPCQGGGGDDADDGDAGEDGEQAEPSSAFKLSEARPSTQRTATACPPAS
jgi:hypothetical protein